MASVLFSMAAADKRRAPRKKERHYMTLIMPYIQQTDISSRRMAGRESMFHSSTLVKMGAIKKARIRSIVLEHA
jgi:hypothetical protein